MQLMNLHFRFRLFPETFETDVPSLTSVSSIVEKANSFLPSANQPHEAARAQMTRWHSKRRYYILAFLV